MSENGILVNVLAIVKVVFVIPNAMIGKTFLPNLQVRLTGLSDLVREAAFDVLHCTFEGDIIRRQNEVNVVRHHDKFVQQELLLCCIAVENM